MMMMMMMMTMMMMISKGCEQPSQNSKRPLEAESAQEQCPDTSSRNRARPTWQHLTHKIDACNSDVGHLLSERPGQAPQQSAGLGPVILHNIHDPLLAPMHADVPGYHCLQPLWVALRGVQATAHTGKCDLPTSTNRGLGPRDFHTLQQKVPRHPGGKGPTSRADQ